MFCRGIISILSTLSVLVFVAYSFFFLKLFFLINTINSLPPLLPPSSALVCTSVCNAVTVRSTCCSSQHATNISVCFFFSFSFVFFYVVFDSDPVITPPTESQPCHRPNVEKSSKKRRKIVFSRQEYHYIDTIHWWRSSFVSLLFRRRLSFSSL